jgi:hypothetical protein
LKDLDGSNEEDLSDISIAFTPPIKIKQRGQKWFAPKQPNEKTKMGPLKRAALRRKKSIRATKPVWTSDSDNDFV